MSSKLSGPIITEWYNQYPNTPFPDPAKHPQMFGDSFFVRNVTYTVEPSFWDQLTGNCCSGSRCCYKGLLDYQCQFNNNCYLNLVSLGLHLLGFTLSLIVLIIAFGYLSKLVYKFVKSIVFIHKTLQCLGGFLKCLSCGIFSQKVYYKNSKTCERRLTQKQIFIGETFQELNIHVLYHRLDEVQKDRIVQIIEDYQIQQNRFFFN